MRAQLQLSDWKALAKWARPIRESVFVHEQGVPIEMEYDEWDSVSLHAVAFDAQATACGTARLVPADSDGVSHIGRMAVLPSARQQGVGCQMLIALVDAAHRRGDRRIVLHAQTHALAFYAKCGFTLQGDVFMEAGLPHQTMVLGLISPKAETPSYF